jgi:hypothetical protein
LWICERLRCTTRARLSNGAARGFAAPRHVANTDALDESGLKITWHAGALRGFIANVGHHVTRRDSQLRRWATSRS